jgi:hypothetical protein
MSDLLARIEALNAESQAWIDEDPSNRWAGMFHTDIEDWNKSGIYTAEDFDAMLDAEYEREVRKSLMYGDYDEYDSVADANYYGWLEFCYEHGMSDSEPEAHVDDYHAALKKYGVATLAMIPTHFEVMANNAGYLEY